jgi:hypothetical protein
MHKRVWIIEVLLSDGHMVLGGSYYSSKKEALDSLRCWRQNSEFAYVVKPWDQGEDFEDLYKSKTRPELIKINRSTDPDGEHLLAMIKRVCANNGASLPQEILKAFERQEGK